MIAVSLERTSEYGEEYPKKIFVTCPICGHIDWFYNFIPRSCEGCDLPRGNVIALIEDIKVRKYYHKKGEID
jgi:hypothetical protein